MVCVKESASGVCFDPPACGFHGSGHNDVMAAGDLVLEPPGVFSFLY